MEKPLSYLHVHVSPIVHAVNKFKLNLYPLMMYVMSLMCLGIS